jgi:hypothetical protein
MSWEAISVISFLLVSFLGWSLKLSSDISRLKSKVESEDSDLRVFLDEFKELKERLIRLEERISLLLRGGREK